MERKTYKVRLNINQAQLLLTFLNGVGYIGPARKVKKQYLKHIARLTKELDDEL